MRGRGERKWGRERRGHFLGGSRVEPEMGRGRKVTEIMWRVYKYIYWRRVNALKRWLGRHPAVVSPSLLLDRLLGMLLALHSCPCPA